MRADDILDEARSTIEDRTGVYSSPTLNHVRIAGLWTTYLGRHILPHEVAVCMALVKVARLTTSPDHRDSYVDGAAYLAIAAEIADDLGIEIVRHAE